MVERSSSKNFWRNIFQWVPLPYELKIFTFLYVNWPQNYHSTLLVYFNGNWNDKMVIIRCINFGDLADNGTHDTLWDNLITIIITTNNYNDAIHMITYHCDQSIFYHWLSFYFDRILLWYFETNALVEKDWQLQCNA